MSERTAFLEAIHADPTEDTSRLVFADFLEENGEPERAEFIRVQVELAGIPPMPETTNGTATPERLAQFRTHLDWQERWHRRYGELNLRSDSLRALHEAAWRACPCPECGGREGRWGRVNGGYDSEWIPCRTCGGTGDLFTKREYDGTDYYPRGDGYFDVVNRFPVTPRRVTFARGFVDSVECRLAEVGEECRWCDGKGCLLGCAGDRHNPTCHHCNGTGFRPSPWAAAVVRASPVSRFVVTDREPFCMNGHEDGLLAGRDSYDWNDERHDHTSTPDRLPGFLFEELCRLFPERVVNPHTNARVVESATLEAATDALAQTAGSLIRRAVN